MTAPPPPAGPIDVLLVAPALEYSAPTLYALTLASGLVERGKRVRVVSPGGRLAPSFASRGIDLDVEPFLERFVVDWFLLRRLVGGLRETGVRIVHAVSSLKVATGAAIARRLGTPAIATVHRYFAANPAETSWAGTAAIITFGEDLRVDCVNNRRAPKDLVRVIPSGIEAPPGNRLPFDRAGAVPIVGTLGDVEKTEAQADFIRAAAEVLGPGAALAAPPADGAPRPPEFLIVTGGAEPRSLRHLARETGVARSVTFTTFSETQKALSLMDICVLPGAQEGPGQTILEAMAAGRPVITTGAGGAYDVIEDEVTGLIVKKGDPASLAAAIRRLVADPALARKLGAAAREAVLERFPLDRMIDETLGVYEACLAAAQPG